MGGTGLLPFKARQVGLNRLGDKVLELLEKVREPIYKAVDWLLKRVARMLDRTVHTSHDFKPVSVNKHQHQSSHEISDQIETRPTASDSGG